MLSVSPPCCGAMVERDLTHLTRPETRTQWHVLFFPTRLPYRFIRSLFVCLRVCLFIVSEFRRLYFWWHVMCSHVTCVDSTSPGDH